MAVFAGKMVERMDMGAPYEMENGPNWRSTGVLSKPNCAAVASKRMCDTGICPQ